MQDAARSLDYIIDTVAADHPLLPLISLLKVNGKLVLVGMPEKPLSLPPVALTSGNSLQFSFIYISFILLILVPCFRLPLFF